MSMDHMDVGLGSSDAERARSLENAVLSFVRAREEFAVAARMPVAALWQILRITRETGRPDMLLARIRSLADWALSGEVRVITDAGDRSAVQSAIGSAPSPRKPSASSDGGQPS